MESHNHFSEKVIFPFHENTFSKEKLENDDRD